MKGRWETVSTFLPKKETKKIVSKYLLISLCLLLITVIYEHFAHGVTSTYMRITFLYPLVGGSGLTLLLSNHYQPSKLTTYLWKMGLTTLVVGSFLVGIFEIYGSIETIVYIYFYIGGALSVSAIILYLIDVLINKAKIDKEDIS